MRRTMAMKTRRILVVGLLLVAPGCDRTTGPHQPSATTVSSPGGDVVDPQIDGTGGEGSEGDDGAPSDEGTTSAVATDTDGQEAADTTADSGGGDPVEVLGEALSAGPPTQDRCDAMPAKDGCHYALIPSSYCGGPQPLPEMLWPRCQCSVCSRDEHCGRGERCVRLPTDAECHPQVMVCVNPKRGCTSHADCTSPGDQCMAVGKRSACRPPTMYAPRP